MSLSSLNFLQNLYSLEAELSTLVAYSSAPEECPELLDHLSTSVRSRLTNLVSISMQYILVTQHLQLVNGEGEDAVKVNGIQYVSQMLVESMMLLLQRVLLQNSGNLSLNRDLLLQLHSRKKLQDSSEQIPSSSENLAILLNTIEQMVDQHHQQTKPSVGSTPSPETGKEKNTGGENNERSE